MANMIEVTVDSVKISLMNAECIVVLREKDGERFLPIYIIRSMADGITAGLNSIVTILPDSWKLIINSLKSLKVKIFRVEILKIVDGTFYANIVAGTENDLKNIDARSSDAIALAVNAHIPIFVASDVMDTAGIVRESDIRVLPSQDTQLHSNTNDDTDEKYLSLYKDYLKNVDWGDQDKDDKKDDKGND